MVALTKSIEILNSYGTNTSNELWQSAFDNLSAESDKAIDYIASERGVLGSQMNRVSEINTNLRSQSLNLSQSNSDLTDVDFAAETSNLGKGYVREFAATNAMKVANEMPSVVKTLMRLWDDIKL